jgi:virulence factor Mce-like protein
MTTSRGPRRESKRPVVVALTGLVVLAGIALVALIAARSPNGLPLVDYRTFYVSVPDPGNLQPHNEVRINGVRVGQVMKPQARDGRALMEVKLDPGTPALPADTKPVVRARGLLGQRYLELVPGKSQTMLADGATIEGGPTSLSYGVPDALNTFDVETRGALGHMLTGFGTGLLGRGDELNRAIEAAPPLGRQFEDVAAAVFAREGAAGRLLPSLRAGGSALDAAREDIAGSFSDASAALRPFNDRRQALQDTLEEAPPALSVAGPALEEGRHLLAATRSVAVAVNDTLPGAPAALRATTALLRESRVPLDRTAALLRTARPAVPAVLRITRSALPVLRPLERALDDLQPVVRAAGEHGCAIDNFAENWRSALGYGIPKPDGGVLLPSGRIGGLGTFRITAVFGPAAVQGGDAPPPALSRPNAYPGPCEYSPGPRFLGNTAGEAGGSR